MAFKPQQTLPDSSNFRGRPFLSGAVREAGRKEWILGKKMVDKHFRGIILPSYDWEGVNTVDAAFDSSVVPFVTKEPDKAAPAFPGFSGWFTRAYVYPMLGEDYDCFVSPEFHGQMEDGTKDPDAFNDLGCQVRFRSNLNSDQVKYFCGTTKKGNVYTDPLIPGRRDMMILNVYATDDTMNGQYEFGVLLISGDAGNYLISQLRYRAPRTRPGLDPNFEDYILGDVTNPNKPMVFRTVQKVPPGSKNNQEVNLLEFVDTEKFPDDPQYLSPPLTAEQLQCRVRLFDARSWNWPTYQEQVDWLVANLANEVPWEYVKAGCGKHGVVPEVRPASNRPASSAAPPGTQEAAPAYGTASPALPGGYTGGAAAPSLPPAMGGNPATPPNPYATQSSTPTPPSFPAAPVTPPPPVDDVPSQPDAKVYIAAPPENIPTEFTRAQLYIRMKGGDRAFQVYVNGAWGSSDLLGFTFPPPLPAAPIVPATPAVPSAPVTPAAPAAPVMPPAAAPAAVELPVGGITPEMLVAMRTDARLAPIWGMVPAGAPNEMPVAELLYATFITPGSTPDQETSKQVMALVM